MGKILQEQVLLLLWSRKYLFNWATENVCFSASNGVINISGKTNQIYKILRDI